MKKTICLALALLLLCGCAPAPTETQAPTMPALEESFPDSLVVTERYTEPEDPAERLAWRRDLVESRMRHMMSMLWTPTEDITYYHSEKATTLYAGEVYRGMPYSHGSGSGMGFMNFATGQDENGVYTISGLEGIRMSGASNAVCSVSNDCADSLFWAWGSVANSITFPYTNKMTASTGCLPVGDYIHTRLEYGSSTKPICKDNGTEVMFASYAQLQKGDGMVLYTNSSGGHAVMVSQVNVVYNEDGSINGEESYVLVLEQISSYLNDESTYYDEALGMTIHLACGVDHQWSFQTIFNKGYLPITCKELIDPTPLAWEVVTDSVNAPTIDNLFSGSLESNYRISHVTVTIYDALDRPVQRLIGYGTEKYMCRYNMMDLRISSRGNDTLGQIDPEALLPGSYHCAVTCTLSTGRTITARDFNFTV